jgi:rubrerythrin
VNVEEAILTAIQYENGVRDLYREAVERSEKPGGKKLFSLMAEEEQRHVDFLDAKLREFRESGRVAAEGPETIVPSKERIEQAGARLQATLDGKASGAERGFLRKAYAAESETSDFYRRMVSELPEEARPLFRRFLEIEEGHLAIVRAQLDRVSSTGYWFDVREFTLEG